MNLISLLLSFLFFPSTVYTRIFVYIFHPKKSSTHQMVSKEMLWETLLSLPASDAFCWGSCASESVHEVEWDVPGAACKWSSSLCCHQRHKSSVSFTLLCWLSWKLSSDLFTMKVEHLFLARNILIMQFMFTESIIVRRQHHVVITHPSNTPAIIETS